MQPNFLIYLKNNNNKKKTVFKGKKLNSSYFKEHAHYGQAITLVGYCFEIFVFYIIEDQMKLQEETRKSE